MDELRREPACVPPLPPASVLDEARRALEKRVAALSLTEVATEVGVNNGVLTRFLNRTPLQRRNLDLITLWFRHFGAGKFSPTRGYPTGVIRRAVRQAIQRTSRADVARQLGMAERSVSLFVDDEVEPRARNRERFENWYRTWAEHEATPAADPDWLAVREAVQDQVDATSRNAVSTKIGIHHTHVTRFVEDGPEDLPWQVREAIVTWYRNRASEAFRTTEDVARAIRILSVSVASGQASQVANTLIRYLREIHSGSDSAWLDAVSALPVSFSEMQAEASGEEPEFEQIQDLLRARVETTSLRQAARESGITVEGLRKLLAPGTSRRPYVKTWERLLDWYARWKTRELISAEEIVVALHILVQPLEGEVARSAMRTLLRVVSDVCGDRGPLWLDELRHDPSHPAWQSGEWTSSIPRAAMMRRARVLGES